MDVLTLPPIALSSVTDTIASWQVVEGQTPLDFTATLDGTSWSAEFLIERCGAVIYRTAATLDATGGVSVTVPAHVGASLASPRRIDAEWQIRLTSPVSPDLDEVWRGAVSVLKVTQ